MRAMREQRLALVERLRGMQPKAAAKESSFPLIVLEAGIEFGLADNFDLAIYLPTWSYEDTNEHSGTQFGSIDVEGIFYVSNPVTDPVGLGLYAEVRVGEESLEFENKLLLQKDVGKWVFLYNLVLETEIEGVFSDSTENKIDGVLGHMPAHGRDADDRLALVHGHVRGHRVARELG